MYKAIYNKEKDYLILIKMEQDTIYIKDNKIICYYNKNNLTTLSFVRTLKKEIEKYNKLYLTYKDVFSKVVQVDHRTISMEVKSESKRLHYIMSLFKKELEFLNNKKMWQGVLRNMELNQLNVYADNYHEPDLVLTYTLKPNTNELDMFKIWISDVNENNLEMINYANLILYNVIINKDKPTQIDIYIAYQKLFGRCQWREYKEITTFVNNEKTLLKPPYNNYKELTREYVIKKIKGMYDKYIKGGN